MGNLLELNTKIAELRLRLRNSGVDLRSLIWSKQLEISLFHQSGKSKMAEMFF
jgi:hypothetical protein